MINKNLARRYALELYAQVMTGGDKEELRRLCREDLFFLLFIACKRKDMNHDWIYERCREVEGESNGYMDLWPRYHYKSTIITFGKTIQDLLLDSDELIGIFSHTRPIAKKFLYQIKSELEGNEFLKDLFPDVLYKNPESESPRWSLDGGIIVKRGGNPKEASVEAWGLVDGQPTGAHFTTMVYDDVVTRESVTTEEMIEKTNEALALSLNLEGKKSDGRGVVRRFVGTRYHMSDTYKMVVERKIGRERVHYPTTLGKEDIEVEGEGVLLTRDELKRKREELGRWVYSSQMLLNPAADRSQGFRYDWVMWYDGSPNGRMNKYILVDSASEQKKGSDYTVMVVVGLGDDGNYYLLDGIRDRLNLTQRCEALMGLHRKWKPLSVGYEKYGINSDIEHVRYVQEREGYRFHIEPIGGAVKKADRIRRLVPIFENRRFYLPRRLFFVNVAGEVRDLVKEFINEYTNFPVSEHDDVLDATSRIVEERLGAKFPTSGVNKQEVMRQEIAQRDWHPLDRLEGKVDVNVGGGFVKGSGGDWKEVLRVRDER